MSLFYIFSADLAANYRLYCYRHNVLLVKNPDLKVDCQSSFMVLAAFEPLTKSVFPGEECEPFPMSSKAHSKQAKQEHLGEQPRKTPDTVCSYQVWE